MTAPSSIAVVSLDNDPDLKHRVNAAYFRRHGAGAAQPDRNGSSIEEHDGATYVVLRNVRGILAVYALKGDGRLKGAKAWPAAIDERF